MPPENAQWEGTSVSFLKTELAFYLWLAVLLGSLSTFALGLLGHIVTLLAAPWLSLRTQATIHATIPVSLTAVKLVTMPLLIFLTPFARHHRTFKSWTDWSTVRLRQAQELTKLPCRLMKAIYSRFTPKQIRPPGLRGSYLLAGLRRAWHWQCGGGANTRLLSDSWRRCFFPKQPEHGIELRPTAEAYRRDGRGRARCARLYNLPGSAPGHQAD